MRLGEPRAKSEGLRIGTVRRPPRGVPQSEYATRNWYDVWLPNLAPTADSVKAAQAAASATQWSAFTRKYRLEMAKPENRRVIELLAALSHHANFSVGCYCADESHCHRSVLRALLAESGARIE